MFWGMPAGEPVEVPEIVGVLPSVCGLLIGWSLVRIQPGELFDFACNPVHHGVNASQPRATLSAFFVSRLSLQGLPHSHRLVRVSVPNPSLPGFGRNGPIESKIGPKSLDLLKDDRHKLTTRSPPRPARDAPRSRDFWAVHR